MQTVKLHDFVDQASRLLLKIAEKDKQGRDAGDIEAVLRPKVRTYVRTSLMIRGIG